MNRTIIGFSLLLVLLILGILAQRQMEQLHDPIARQLDQAADFAANEDWTSARALAENAQKSWRRGWHLSAALADHEPMEDIDSQFARLEVFSQEEDSMEYAAACRELSRRVLAMADAHRLNWWNLF